MLQQKYCFPTKKTSSLFARKLSYAKRFFGGLVTTVNQRPDDKILDWS